MRACQILGCIILLLITTLTLAQTYAPIKTGCYYVVDTCDSCIFITGQADSVYIYKTAIVTINDFQKVKLRKTDYGADILEITLRKEAKEILRVASAKWIKKKFAIIISNELVSAPVVMTEIDNGTFWIGMSSSLDELKKFKKMLDEEMNSNR